MFQSIEEKNIEMLKAVLAHTNANPNLVLHDPYDDDATALTKLSQEKVFGKTQPRLLASFALVLLQAKANPEQQIGDSWSFSTTVHHQVS